MFLFFRKIKCFSLMFEIRGVFLLWCLFSLWCFFLFLKFDLFFNKQPLCLISHFVVWFFSLMFDFRSFQLFNFSIYFDDNTFCFLLWCVKFIIFLLLLLVISLLFDVQCGTFLRSLTENFFHLHSVISMLKAGNF